MITSPACGVVDARDHVEQGRLAAPRLAHNGDKLAVVQLQIDGFEGDEFARGIFVHLVDIVQGDGRIGFSALGRLDLSFAAGLTFLHDHLGVAAGKVGLGGAVLVARLVAHARWGPTTPSTMCRRREKRGAKLTSWVTMTMVLPRSTSC